MHIHTLTVRRHRVSCDSPVLVQHGMGHDAVALDLDAEWDGLSARLVLGPCESAYDVLYEGEPVVVPAATLAEAGWLPVSVVGHGGDGTVRVTTERCDHLLRVVESGCTDGSVPPEDQPDLLGQLVEAAERAEASAEAADKATAEATGAASAATEAAGKVDAAVESAAQATEAAKDAATAATDAAKSATDAAERADKLAEDIPGYVTAAQQAATEAARAASEADGAATAAGKSASAAAGSAEQASGSATSAQGSADAASGSAQQAATSAGEAEGSATAASESATEAKSSASAAAQSATDAKASAALAAGWVPAGGEPGQILTKTEDGTAWRDAPSGNVLTGTATGYVAHAEDAYAQKPIEVRVKGKTWANRWPAINGTSSGITVSTDETGLITVSGTSTAPVRSIIIVMVPALAGKAYTVATTSANSGMSRLNYEIAIDASRSAADNDFIANMYSPSNGGSGKTFTTPADTAGLACIIRVDAGLTVNASFRVMLVEGSEAPDLFVPTGLHSVEPKKMVTAGKNLVNLDGAEYVKSSSSSSSSATFGDDGSVTITGATDSWNGCYIELKSVELPPGSYVASGFSNGDMLLLLTSPNVLNPSASGNYYTGVGYPFKVSMSAGQSAAFKIDAPSRVAFSTGDQISDGAKLTLYPQIELGSTATAYEPPNVTTTPLPEVELRSLPDGTCDELVIKADGTCEVERKTYSYTATGEESVSYSNNKASFDTGIPFTWVSGSSVRIYCDKLPTAQPGITTTGCVIGVVGDNVSIYFNIEGETTDVDTTKAWLASNTPKFVFIRNKTTEPQSPVTLPVLPAPTFNIYHGADVPSDTAVEYVRDINIVIDNLAKQIAGTAATVAINEATR